MLVPTHAQDVVLWNCTSSAGTRIGLESQLDSRHGLEVPVKHIDSIVKHRHVKKMLRKPSFFWLLYNI